MELFSKIKEKIEQFDNIILLRHVQPDGDAYGSCFGLREVIKDNYPNKKVYCLGESYGSDFELFFGKLDSLNISDYSSYLFISLDNPTIERLDYSNKDKMINLIKIDHHILVENYGEIEWVDTSFSSCCEMVTTLVKELNYNVSPLAATYLYLGLLTDAGRFLYSYTPNLFESAKFLVEHQADVARIHPFIYEQDIKSTRFHGYCQSQFKTSPHGVGYNKLTPDFLSSAGISAYEGAGMVNALSNMKGIDIWAHFSEIKEGGIRAELRSKGLPVNLVAAEFGGGGHKQAAGCTLLNWDEVDRCLEKLDRMIFESKNYYQQMESILKVIKEASNIALSFYTQTNLEVETKQDNSPVTIADKTVDKYIRDELSKLYPDYAFLSEETEDDLKRLENDYCFIIDPIDGTKDFIAHDDEWAINVALSYKNEIVCSAMSIPAKGIIYYAFKDGGAFKDDNGNISRIYTCNASENLIEASSHFHVADEDKKYYKQYSSLITQHQSIGSAYKFGLLAEGKIDITVKLSEGTKEWDIAPGVLIVKEAGGSFTKPSGEEYKFNKKDVYNHDGYIVMGKFNKGLLK